MDARTSRKAATFLVALEGEESARAGEPASANPYETGTFERLQWLGGWMKAATRGDPSACT
jgi:ribosome modulation factor